MISKFKLRKESGSQLSSIKEISPELLHIIKQELMKNQAQNPHLSNLNNSKINEAVKLKEKLDPKKIISLDDEDFGKF
jgi:hypothetical protein